MPPSGRRRNPNQKGDAALKMVAEPAMGPERAVARRVSAGAADDGRPARLGAEPRRRLPCLVQGRARLGAATARQGAADRQPQEHRAAEGDRRAGAADAADGHQDRARRTREVVYVPAYNPTVVYGAWPYPAYPPYYYPPAPATTTPARRSRPASPSVSAWPPPAALWGNCNWGGGNVNVNVNRYNSVNANRQISANQTNFQHNAANRRGVPYRDSASRQQFGKDVAGASQRADYRGRDTAPRRAAPAGAIAVAAARHGPGPGSRPAAQRSGHTRSRAGGCAGRGP